MGIKRENRLVNDDSAAIPAFIVGIAWLIGIAAASAIVIAAYQLTIKPDVVYNISDTGFSIAGMDTNTIYIIAAVIIGLIIMYMVFRKKD